jgi:mono/diheme cytochrome c family protein
MHCKPIGQRASVRRGAKNYAARPPVFGLIIVCGLLLSLPSRASAADTAAQMLFGRFCSQCHGTDGRGAPARAGAAQGVAMPEIPDFTDRAWQLSRSNVQLKISIIEGKNQHMPANRDMVNDQLAGELVSFVRAFGPPPPKPVASVKPKPAPASSPSAVSSTPGNTTLIAVPEYTPTGDFETDFDNLAKQFEAYQKQAHQLAVASASKPRAPVAPPAPVVSNPPPAPAPVAETPPTAPPPGPVSPASPGQPAAEKPRVTSVPVSERPLTPEDIALGEELFLGRRSFANGGTACVACHVVNRGEAREGGRLGPQLTKAYERLGGRTALSARLWAPTTPTMRAAHLQHRLEPNEVLAIVAYLEDADQHAAEDTAPLRLKFLLAGLGGAVLGLGAFSALWGSRSRSREAARAANTASQQVH